MTEDWNFIKIIFSPPRQFHRIVAKLAAMRPTINNVKSSLEWGPIVIAGRIKWPVFEGN